MAVIYSFQLRSAFKPRSAISAVSSCWAHVFLLWLWTLIYHLGLRTWPSIKLNQHTKCLGQSYLNNKYLWSVLCTHTDRRTQPHTQPITPLWPLKLYYYYYYMVPAFTHCWKLSENKTAETDASSFAYLYLIFRRRCSDTRCSREQVSAICYSRAPSHRAVGTWPRQGGR